MEYKVKILGKMYDLPARTLSVDELIEKIGALDEQYKAKTMTRREVVEEMHAFVENFAPGVLPPVDEVDTNELTTICTDIIEAYTAPARKAKNEKQMKQLQEVLNRPEVRKAFEAMSAAEKLNK